MNERAIQDSRQRRIRRRIRRGAFSADVSDGAVRPARFQRRRLLATFDKPLVAVVILLLAIGSLMVFSSTWDWSNELYGTMTGFFVEEHLRNVLLSVLALVIFAAIDYRFWKRFAVWLLLITIILLVAVLAFGEVIFGAKRSFTDGRLQPGELAEFGDCSVYGGLARL